MEVSHTTLISSLNLYQSFQQTADAFEQAYRIENWLNWFNFMVIQTFYFTYNCCGHFLMDFTNHSHERYQRCGAFKGNTHIFWYAIINHQVCHCCNLFYTLFKGFFNLYLHDFFSCCFQWLDMLHESTATTCMHVSAINVASRYRHV